ncbi:hypothetical protein AS850_02620 [Frondihabitans sp. 762G35]|uniref:hypothetical protein n=1 Tax=Frondihabitans sp. 762G35 TaxID=1446794 RepID=UPI000D21FEE3|nr:hypothetical protein [Frondihabitans sp. 762G35]ARC55966.1 hypothetical protein AS850_02620 [Frondihabitans sp. 762G35]
MADTTNYATVTGRLLAPSDNTPLTGYVKFTPASAMLDQNAPATRVPARVVGALDADGYLVQDGHRGVRLFGSDAGVPGGVTWRVEFSQLRANGKIVHYDPFDFIINAGETRDLTALSPVPSSPGTAPGPGAAAGVSMAEVQSALQVHVDDVEPHPAYDDIPDLALFYANRKAVL